MRLLSCKILNRSLVLKEAAVKENLYLVTSLGIIESSVAKILQSIISNFVIR